MCLVASLHPTKGSNNISRKHQYMPPALKAAPPRNPGALSLSTDLKGKMDGIALNNLKAAIGKASVADAALILVISGDVVD